MFLAIGVIFGLVYILLLKIYTRRWIASVVATTGTISNTFNFISTNTAKKKPYGSFFIP